MFHAVMSNPISLSEEASVSSGNKIHDFGSLNPMVQIVSPQQPQIIQKKRNLPGNPDPGAEVIALSPKTLLATNRFVCEICNKGFQRDQNLQLHRRGHNLPWKLKQRNSKEIKKRAYVCPEPTCVHHHPSRALGDLTGIKKHYCRKHGEKKWKCEKCSKIYAVNSDCKAHSKTCGTREYRCDCGTLFSRKDSFINHRAFCDALAEETARLSANSTLTTNPNPTAQPQLQPFLLHPQNPLSVLLPLTTQHQHISFYPSWNQPQNPNPKLNPNPVHIKPETILLPISSPFYQEPPPPHPTLTSPFQNLHFSTQPTSAHLSATALLQKAVSIGAQSVAGHVPSSTMAQFDISTMGHVSTGISPEYLGFTPGSFARWQKSDRLTRDFLGLTGDHRGDGGNGSVDVNVNVRNLLSFTGDVEFPTYDRDHSLLKHQAFGFADEPASETWGNC
ncbi:unnamed protein product [Ilex paraguariensis]|uniref:C2H2-type domain-containing protein n=1 Tax=Ilex paraguariensis TaxID=185542 RepID=A0ABC8RFM1_9AQUA